VYVSAKGHKDVMSKKEEGHPVPMTQGHEILKYWLVEKETNSSAKLRCLRRTEGSLT